MPQYLCLVCHSGVQQHEGRAWSLCIRTITCGRPRYSDLSQFSSSADRSRTYSSTAAVGFGTFIGICIICDRSRGLDSDYQYGGRHHSPGKDTHVLPGHLVSPMSCSVLLCTVTVNRPELDQNWVDAGNNGPILAQFWFTRHARSKLATTARYWHTSGV